jgi:nitrate/nitrite transporter NarK
VSREETPPYLLLAGACVLIVGMAAYELAPASITPLIRDSLGVGPSAAGLLVGVMFGTAVVTSVPIGIGLDRTDSRTATVAAVGMLLLAGAWGWQAASAGNFASLLASRFVGGVAFTLAWNAAIDVVGRSFGPARRGTAVGLVTASGPVGFALAQGASPLVAAAVGWPAVFPAYTGFAVVGVVSFWLGSRGQGRADGTATPGLAAFRRVLTEPAVWTVGGIGFLAYTVYLFVNSWAPSYLTGELGLTLASSGLVAALFPAVGALSRAGGGLLSDRVFGGRRRPVLLLAFAVSTPVVAGFTLLVGTPVVIGALLLSGFAVQLSIGLSFAYVRELVEPAVAATAVAFLTSVSLAGAFLSPTVGGVVVETAGYSVAFVTAGLLGALGLALAWIAPEP